MAHICNEFTLPEGVWNVIAQYADVCIGPEVATTNDIWKLGAGEDDRRFGALVGQLLCTGMQTQEIPTGQYVENSLISRRELIASTGAVVPIAVAQRASLMECVAQSWFDHRQSFPMQLTFEDGEGVMQEIEHDPAFDVARVVDTMLTPGIPFMGETLVNPWVFRYLVRQIACDQQVVNAPEGVRSAIKCRRLFLLVLKAEILSRLLHGFIVGAYASPLAVDEPLNKYAALLQLVVGKLWALWAALQSVLLWVMGCVNLNWYHTSSPECQAVVDLLTAAVMIYAVLTFWRQLNVEPALVAVVERGLDIYLGQLATDKGIVHRVRVNGRELSLSAFPEARGFHQEEMSMPNSEYFPCRAQPIGAILVTSGTTDLQLFGTFWRMDEYFVTARHCSNTLYQSTAKAYLATVRSTKKGNFEIDRSSVWPVPEGFFDPENNVIASYDIDAFACELTAKQWSQIRIKEASTKIRSAYGQQVHSVGFTQDGLLVSASGKTLPGSGYETLNHTASTQKGFSGSVILCGNSVVGMHVSAAGDHNVAVRTEMIQYLIDVGSGLESATKNRKKYTYADASVKEQYRQHKWRGAVSTIKTMRDGKYAIVLEKGEATYGWSMKDIVDCFGLTGDPRKDEDLFEDMLMGGNFRLRPGPQYVDYDDDRYHKNDYENVSISSVGTRRGKKANQRGGKSAPRGGREPFPARVPKKDNAWLFDETTGLKPVHGPSAPKVQPEATQVIENHKEKIVELGYEEGLFAYPAMTPEEERKSLVAHLELFGEKVRKITRQPTPEEMKRCGLIVATMLSENSFMPDKDYDQLPGILDIIHSSIISPDKSSGYPYCAEGQPTNGQVLGSFGEKAFAQHVLNEWLGPIDLKWFEKGEPTKKTKLEKGMPRGIACFPLHATVAHASILRNFANSLVRNFKKSPIKYAFSPANPGHLEHLKDVLPGKVWMSDKETWDFSFHEWVSEVCCQTTQHLAVRHPDWDEERLAKYKSDVRKMFDQVFKNSRYRTSDGTLYEMKVTGIMKSGWYGTIAINSMAQLVIHVMTCMMMGLEDEAIVAIPIFVGGDDVNQDPADLDKQAYIATAASTGVGMVIHDAEDLEHSEFFSSDIRRGPDGLTYHPQRWTKHIEHLKTIKLEHLGDALCSHMENYRHEAEKFVLLENMYHELRETHPDSFPISKLKSRSFLIAKQYGYEQNYFLG